MKTSKFSSLIVAGIFSVIPAFLSANPNDIALDGAIVTPASNKIQELRNAIGYPQIALKNNIQGKFTLLVNVDEAGKVTSVNFEVNPESSVEDITPLLREVSIKIYAFNFGQEFANQAVRIPFNFRLY